MGVMRRYAQVGLLVTSLAVPLSGLAAGDTSANAMVCGGAASKQELLHKLQAGDCNHHSGAELKRQFTSRGVTLESLQALPSQPNGRVTKDGRVIMDGKVVATNARSYGRSNISGSQKDGNLYVRSTSVSFNSDSLPAFVSVSNGRFNYAIVASCGNLVKATPVVAKTKQPTVNRPTVVQTVKVEQVQVQAQNQTQTTPAPAATKLPETGMGTAGIGALSLMATAGLYYRRSRRQLANAILRSR